MRVASRKLGGCSGGMGSRLIYTSQGLPLGFLKEDAAGYIRHFTAQLGQMQNPPGNHHIYGQTGFDAIGMPELPLFDLAAAFQGAVVDLDAPAQRIPLQSFQRLFKGGDLGGGQQHPFQGLDLLGRSTSRA